MPNPNDRPDYVKCISRTIRTANGVSWCGRHQTGFGEFRFLSLDHAAESNLQGSRLLPCEKCVEAAVSALREGQ